MHNWQNYISVKKYFSDSTVCYSFLFCTILVSVSLSVVVHLSLDVAFYWFSTGGAVMIVFQNSAAMCPAICSISL